jgi:hypothetical protein
MAAAVFAIEATAPVDRSMIEGPLARVVVTFTREVDASLVNDSTVALQRIDGGTDAATVLDMPAVKALSAQNAAVLIVTPRTPLGAGTYRLTVRGTGGGAFADNRAVTLGTDPSFEFTVEPAR